MHFKMEAGGKFASACLKVELNAADFLKNLYLNTKISGLMAKTIVDFSTTPLSTEFTSIVTENVCMYLSGLM